MNGFRRRKDLEIIYVRPDVRVLQLTLSIFNNTDVLNRGRAKEKIRVLHSRTLTRSKKLVRLRF